MRAFRRAGILAAAAAAILSSGCANSLVSGTIERRMKGKLSELLGTADSYELEVRGGTVPVSAAMLLMVKGYLVTAPFVPEQALTATFVAWPPNILPMFVAMMFAGTLGGKATRIGALANVVCVGICASHGKPMSFLTFCLFLLFSPLHLFYPILYS